MEVTLPNGAVAKYPLERLTRLYDTLEQLEDLWGEGSAQDEQEHDHDHEHETEVWAMDEDGIWQAQPNGDDENDEWEETDEEDEYVMEVEGDTRMEDIHVHAPDNEVHTSWWDHIVPTVTAVPPDQQDTASVSQVPSSTLRSSSPDVPRDATEKEDVLVDEAGINGAEDGDRESHWKRFEVIPEAPRDHAFFNSTPSQPSRNFLTRLQKEYRALSSSLPGQSHLPFLAQLHRRCEAESILVRAYEDRSDLLRSLIIGPENTPYEDAPFVIDWMLDSDFPQSPPIAHFLSWTNGNGRGM